MTKPKPKSEHKPRGSKPGGKKASFTKAADELQEKVVGSSTFNRNTGLHKHVASALDVLTGIQTEKREDRVNGLPEREPEHKIDPDTGLLVDEFGVPFIEDKKIRKTKDHNRKRTPEQRQLIAKRIQDARGLITLFYTVEDASRMLSASWGISKASCLKYLAIARKQNQAILKRQAPEWKSDSLMFWTQKLHSSQNRKQQAQKRLGETEEMIKELSTHIKIAAVEDVNGFKLKQLRDIQSNYIRQADHMRRTINVCDYQIDSYGDRVDRLVGNNAPERIALTDAAGNDLAANLREPITVEDRNRQLAEALRTLSASQLASLGFRAVETVEAAVLPSESEAPLTDPDQNAIYPIEIDSDANYADDE